MSESHRPIHQVVITSDSNGGNVRVTQTGSRGGNYIRDTAVDDAAIRQMTKTIEL